MKIGVFDSGLGGLVITKAFIDTLPQYDYLYLGDTAHLPYGEKTSGRILKYTLDAMKWLIKHDCKLIIIACNTATSICLRYIQQKFIRTTDLSPLSAILTLHPIPPGTRLRPRPLSDLGHAPTRHARHG